MSKKRKPLTEEQKRRRYEAHKRWLAKDPANVEKVREATRKWREENKEHLAEYAKQQWANPETRAKKQEWHRAWTERNRERVIAKSIDLMHRGRVLSPELAGTFSLDEWKAMLDDYDHRCGYCGKGGVRLDRDHIVPLSRGGRHDASNIIPACRSCNMRKGAKLVSEWLAA